MCKSAEQQGVLHRSGDVYYSNGVCVGSVIILLQNKQQRGIKAVEQPGQMVPFEKHSK